MANSNNTQAQIDFRNELTPSQRLLMDNSADNAPSMVQDFQDMCGFNENDAHLATINVFDYECMN